MTTECFNQNCQAQDEHCSVCKIDKENCPNRQKEWGID